MIRKPSTVKMRRPTYRWIMSFLSFKKAYDTKPSTVKMRRYKQDEESEEKPRERRARTGTCGHLMKKHLVKCKSK